MLLKRFNNKGVYFIMVLPHKKVVILRALQSSEDQSAVSLFSISRSQILSCNNNLNTCAGVQIGAVNKQT